ncbi:unnamed protein product [Calicophoron daubneyi]|uniref:Uncharacterized protein n=1 Tax=Calicophoron daubneyi TaxID=300641 RepID=A0AAV2SZ45_CALDB
MRKTRTLNDKSLEVGLRGLTREFEIIVGWVVFLELLQAPQAHYSLHLWTLPHHTPGPNLPPGNLARIALETYLLIFGSPRIRLRSVGLI